jgi:hypothetical protein
MGSVEMDHETVRHMDCRFARHSVSCDSGPLQSRKAIRDPSRAKVTSTFGDSSLLVPPEYAGFQADPMNSRGHGHKLFRNSTTSGEFQSTELTNLRLNIPARSMM